MQYTQMLSLFFKGISIPLLKLRPRKDMVETLLHEMIHAYLFVTDNNDDHDGHGPEFHKHMYRINKATGIHLFMKQVWTFHLPYIIVIYIYLLLLY